MTRRRPLAYVVVTDGRPGRTWARKRNALRCARATGGTVATIWTVADLMATWSPATTILT